GLSRPVGAQQREDLAGPDLQVDVLQRLDARGVGFRQAGDLDDGPQRPGWTCGRRRGRTGQPCVVAGIEHGAGPGWLMAAGSRGIGSPPDVGTMRAPDKARAGRAGPAWPPPAYAPRRGRSTLAPDRLRSALAGDGFWSNLLARHP